MEFGDYIVYVDESGDHGLASIDPNYPVFVLACCILRKYEYGRTAIPGLLDFNFRLFGHDQVVLHEPEIRKRRPGGTRAGIACPATPWPAPCLGTLSPTARFSAPDPATP